MATKTHDLVVKIGEYTKDGEKKNRYENIGSVFENEDGGSFMLLKRTFNPAGVPNPDNKDSVIVSRFEVKGYEADTATPKKSSMTADDEDIPF